MKIFALMMALLIFSSSYIVWSREFTVPVWARNATIYEVNVRQYTEEGSFSAFREHLPRLEEMKVGILWLMPVNPIGEKNRKGSLGSYYSISDYEGLNIEFGNEEDFRELVEDIHRRGMRVIIDWVANHTSWDHKWTETHPEYYKHDSDGNFYPPVKDWSDVIQLDYSNPGLRQEMIAAMKFWVKKYDIDGFRCDVAEMVPLDFWVKARAEIEKIKPVFMLAECENPAYQAAFDMTYAWSAFKLFKDISTGSRTAIDLDAYLMRSSRIWEKDDIRMLFLSNHDENSWSGSMLKHFPESYRAFTVLTYALPGMPLVYSGQEALNEKQLEFFDKDEIEWKDTCMDTLYRNLNYLKRGKEFMHHGKYGLRKIGNNHPYEVYSILRESDNGEKGIFVINLTADTHEVKLRNIEGEYIEYSLTTGKAKSTLEDGLSSVVQRKRRKIEITAPMILEPYDYRIFIQQKRGR